MFNRELASIEEIERLEATAQASSTTLLGSPSEAPKAPSASISPSIRFDVPVNQLDFRSPSSLLLLQLLDVSGDGTTKGAQYSS